MVVFFVSGCTPFENSSEEMSRSAFRSNGEPILVPQDFPTIQDALAVAVQGDSIIASETHIDPGFLINRQIASNISISGAGAGLSKIIGPVEITNKYAGPLEISGFTITNPNGVGFLAHFNVDNITIKNCTITECANDGVRVEFQAGIQQQYQNNSHAATISLEYCEISSNIGRGVSANSFSAVSLTGCNISNNGGDGVYAASLSVANLDGCTVAGNLGHGAMLYRQTTGSIVNSSFSNNAGNAVYVVKMAPFDCSSTQLPSAYSQYSVKPIIVTNNLIENNLRGILLEDRVDAEQINNNSLINNTEGIVLTTRSTTGSMASNTVEGPGDYGIVFQQQSFGNMDSNVVTGFEGKAGVFIDRMDETAVDAPACPAPQGWLQKVTLSNNTLSGNAVNLFVNQGGICDLGAGNDIHDAISHGIHALINSNLNISPGNKIYGNLGSGVYFEQLSTGTVLGAEIYNNGIDGISMERMEDLEGDRGKAVPVTIDSCTIQNNGEWGVRVGFNEQMRGRAWAEASNNTITGNGSGGIVVQSTSRANIINNILQGIGQDDFGAAFFRESDGLLEANTISGFMYGVAVAQLISSPDVLGPEYPFVFEAVKVNRNYIENNTGNGITVGLGPEIGQVLSQQQGASQGSGQGSGQASGQGSYQWSGQGQGDAVIVNNMISANGLNGVFINQISDGIQPPPIDLFNNTIAYNAQDGIHGVNSAISNSTNNAIVNNGAFGIFADSDAVHTINNDLIFGNAQGDHIQINGGFVTDNGYLSEDPLFDGANRPLAGSPCIDAGISVEGVPVNDIDDDPRPLGLAIDIGADENAP